MKNIADNMTDIFYRVLLDLENEGFQRTQNEPLEILNYSFTLTDINNNIVCANGIDLGYLCAEELWFILENEELEFINSFNAPGFQRSSEDGIYSNSAYGHIVHKRYGFDQVEQVIEILKKKPHSRRAVINLNVPNRHRRTCYDEICTFNLSFYIIDGKLNCTCCMRSNDMIGCMPYDVAYFTNLQKYIAHRLGVEYGTYYHFAISAHHYSKLNFRELCAKYSLLEHKVYFDYDLMLKLKPYLYNYFKKEILHKNDDNKEKNNELLKHECEKLRILTNDEVIKENDE